MESFLWGALYRGAAGPQMITAKWVPEYETPRIHREALCYLPCKCLSGTSQALLRSLLGTLLRCTRFAAKMKMTIKPVTVRLPQVCTRRGATLMSRLAQAIINYLRKVDAASRCRGVTRRSHLRCSCAARFFGCQRSETVPKRDDQPHRIKSSGLERRGRNRCPTGAPHAESCMNTNMNMNMNMNTNMNMNMNINTNMNMNMNMDTCTSTRCTPPLSAQTGLRRPRPLRQEPDERGRKASGLKNR